MPATSSACSRGASPAARPAEVERHAQPVAQEHAHVVARVRAREQRQHDRVTANGPLDEVPHALVGAAAVGSDHAQPQPPQEEERALPHALVGEHLVPDDLAHRYFPS
jgi:hypothetical protein